VEEWFVGFENLKKEPEIEFLGIAIDVRYPCTCRYCEKGKEALEERGQGTRGNQLHIVIAPLGNYVKLQHAYIDMTRRFRVSRRGVWEHAIMVNRIPFKTKKELEEFLKSKVILWKKMTIKDYCIEKMKMSEKELEALRERLNLKLEAMVLYPEKVIPKDALELYELTEDEVKKRVKIYKKAWKRLLKGEDEETVYQWVVEQLAEELETEKKEEEEEETEEREDEEVLL